MRDGTMFPCLMVIDAAVYFRGVFMCQSQFLHCCYCKGLNKEAFFSCLSGVLVRHGRLWGAVLGPVVHRNAGSTVHFSKDQRARFDLCVQAEAKSYAPVLSLTLSLISLVLLPLFFYICPSPSLPLPSLPFPSIPSAWSQTTAQIYRWWRDASGGQTRERLPVCLPYHSLWLI